MKRSIVAPIITTTNTQTTTPAPTAELFETAPKAGDVDIPKDVRPSINLTVANATSSDGSKLVFTCNGRKIVFTSTSNRTFGNFSQMNVSLTPQKGSVAIGENCTLAGSVTTTGPGGTVSTAINTSFSIYAAPVANATTLLAGTADSPGSKDGARLAATFNTPGAMARDAQGNIYVTDGCTGDIKSHALIRKISPAGMVSTTGGSNAYGGSYYMNNFDGKRCWTLTTHPDGNLYTADWVNAIVERITPSGEITTIAGLRGSTGSTDGLGTAARFNRPFGIASDTQGNLFVSDINDHTIRKIDVAGNVTTYAGQAGVVGTADGAVQSARFNSPTSLKFDSNGKLYVSDRVGIRVIDNGIVTTAITFATMMRDMCSVGAILSTSDIDISSDGRLAITIANCSTVGVYKNNQLQTLLGAYSGNRNDVDGTAAASRFFFPSGLAFSQTGELLISDNAFHNIKTYSANNNQVILYAGKRYPSVPTDGSLGVSKLTNPFCLHLSANGDIWFNGSNGTNTVVRKLDTAGNVTSFPQLISGNSGANCVVKTNADGSFIAADLIISKSLRLFNAAGQFIQLLSSNYERFPSSQQNPVDANGSIYFGGPDGFISKYANGATTAFSTTKIGVGNASSLAISSTGQMYASDGCTIYQISSGGVPTALNTPALPWPCDYEDGPIAKARFSFIRGLAVGNSGEIYVADMGNSVIRRIYKGQVDTVAGTLWVDETSIGAGTGAIHGLRGIAHESSTNSLILLGNNAILRVQLPALQ